jgi:hypothetical protein
MNNGGCHKHYYQVLQTEEAKHWLLDVIAKVREKCPRQWAQEYIQQQAKGELDIERSNHCDVESFVCVSPASLVAPCRERTDAKKNAHHHNQPAQVRMREQDDSIGGHARFPFMAVS